MVAYLAGFAMVQMAIALLFFTVGRGIVKASAVKPSINRHSLETLVRGLYASGRGHGIFVVGCAGLAIGRDYVD
ncbi:MAG: hypothetical protein AAFO06_18405 [Cyanobacteria bacterium J06597_16]